MGDQNAVDIVQAVHVDLLSAGGAIADTGLIRYRHAIPDTGVLEGVQIDDLIVANVARNRDFKSKDRQDKVFIEGAHKACQDSGLARFPDKAFGSGAGTSLAMQLSRHGELASTAGQAT